jgi:hypothetical protein
VERNEGGAVGRTRAPTNTAARLKSPRHKYVARAFCVSQRGLLFRCDLAVRAVEQPLLPLCPLGLVQQEAAVGTSNEQTLASETKPKVSGGSNALPRLARSRRPISLNLLLKPSQPIYSPCGYLATLGSAVRSEHVGRYLLASAPDRCLLYAPGLE